MYGSNAGVARFAGGYTLPWQEIRKTGVLLSYKQEVAGSNPASPIDLHDHCLAKCT